MAKKLKAILRTVFLVAVALVLGVNVYLWNARSLMGNALPMPFGYGCAVVLSGLVTRDTMAVSSARVMGSLGRNFPSEP